MADSPPDLSTLRTIRRAVAAARNIAARVDPPDDDLGAMSKIIMKGSQRARELLVDPEAGAPRLGTLGFIVKDMKLSEESERELLELLREALEIPDFESQVAAAMQRILIGELPRVAGFTRDDDDDDLTEEERVEQLAATAMNAREALSSIGVPITMDQAVQFTHRFWELIDEYNASQEAEHARGVAEVVDDLKASGAEVEVAAGVAAVENLEERLGNAYGAAVMQALAEHGVEMDLARCKSIMARVGELKFGIKRDA